MKSKPHGKAIIINIEKYDKAKKNRDGSNTDLVNLTLLLTNLGFKVDTWSNYDSRVSDPKSYNNTITFVQIFFKDHTHKVIFVRLSQIFSLEYQSWVSDSNADSSVEPKVCMKSQLASWAQLFVIDFINLSWADYV